MIYNNFALSATVNLVNTSEISAHINALHHLAAESGAQGKLVIAGFGEGLAPVVQHFAIGATVEMTNAAVTLANEPGRNVYSPLAVMRHDLPEGKKGTEADVVAVLGAVVDGDADHGREAPQPPVPADYIIETSPGNLQHFIFFEQALKPDEAKPVMQALQRQTGADCAGDTCHVWRISGTGNWPTESKLRRGRSEVPFPVRTVQGWNGSRTTPAALRAAVAGHLVERTTPRTIETAANKSNEYEIGDIVIAVQRMTAAQLFVERKEWIRAGQCLHHYFGGSEEGFRVWQYTFDEPETPQKAVEAWESFKRKDGPLVTIMTLFQRAHDAGVKFEVRRSKEAMFRDVPREHLSGGAEIIQFPGHPPGVIPPPPGPAPAAPAKLIQTDAEFIGDFKPPEYLLDGILQRRYCYSMTAATGAGKTAIALLLSECVGLGRRFGDREVQQGNVIYFAAENPDDVRARWLAMAEHHNFTIGKTNVHVVSGAVKFSEITETIMREAAQLGEIALVVIDTSAATFEGADENDNVAAIEHAKRMRCLTTLPGGPTVLVLCHPTKRAGADDLQPRGGGAFVAEIDGNLCVRKKDGAAELHHAIKFRGPDFAPITFAIETVTAKALKDSRGRSMPSVIARTLDAAGTVKVERKERHDQDAVLRALDRIPGSTPTEVARSLAWFLGNGDPAHVKVKRILEGLQKEKLVEVRRSKWRLASKGQIELNEMDKIPPLPPS